MSPKPHICRGVDAEVFSLSRLIAMLAYSCLISGGEVAQRSCACSDGCYHAQSYAMDYYYSFISHTADVYNRVLE